MKAALASLLLAGLVLIYVGSSMPDLDDYKREAADAVRSSTENNKAPSIVYPPLRHFSAMVSKPLFVASRVGTVARVGKNKVVSENQPLALVGVIETPLAKFAVMKERHEKVQYRVAVGESIKGWTVESLTSSSVTLKQESQQLLLLLYDKTQAKNASATVPSIGIAKAVAAREAALPRGSVTRAADMSRLVEVQGRVEPNVEAQRLMDEFEEQINEQHQ